MITSETDTIDITTEVSEKNENSERGHYLD